MSMTQARELWRDAQEIGISFAVSCGEEPTLETNFDHMLIERSGELQVAYHESLNQRQKYATRISCLESELIAIVKERQQIEAVIEIVKRKQINESNRSYAVGSSV